MSIHSNLHLLHSQNVTGITSNICLRITPHVPLHISWLTRLFRLQPYFLCFDSSVVSNLLSSKPGEVSFSSLPINSCSWTTQIKTDLKFFPISSEGSACSRTSRCTAQPGFPTALKSWKTGWAAVFLQDWLVICCSQILLQANPITHQFLNFRFCSSRTS